MAKKSALARWLESRGHGAVEALARAADCSRNSIVKTRDGAAPGVALARRISAATEHEVSVADLLGLSAEERAS